MNHFFCCERLSASMARSLHLSFICIPQSTRALDQGGVEPRQAVSPRPLGHGRYRFATVGSIKGVNHISVVVQCNFGSPDHAFDMYFSLDSHCTAEGHEYSLSDSMAPIDPAVP